MFQFLCFKAVVRLFFSLSYSFQDDKYWKRRAKNNEAAKRSRDLRREKESQIMQRVQVLERENAILHSELQTVSKENKDLKERLARYEQV